MTLKELSQWYYINQTIQNDIEELEKLRAKSEPHGMKLSDAPRSTSRRNMVEEVALDIIEAEEKLTADLAKAQKAKAAIEEYINSVDDYQIRLIFKYRFKDLLSWREVADRIGGNNTEDGVKKKCYRFLKNSEKSKKK